MTTLREKALKIDAKVVSRARFIIFHLAEGAVSRQLLAAILGEDTETQAPCRNIGVAGVSQGTQIGECCRTLTKSRKNWSEDKACIDFEGGLRDGNDPPKLA